MHGDHRLGVTLHNLLTQWNTGPFALLTLVTVLVAGVWYGQSAWALSAKGRTWSRWRTTSFLTGLVMIDLALQSPVSTFTMGYFEAHMVQHLLLMVTAPPLLALGAPMTLALQTSPFPVASSCVHVNAVPTNCLSTTRCSWVKKPASFATMSGTSSIVGAADPPSTFKTSSASAGRGVQARARSAPAISATQRGNKAFMLNGRILRQRKKGEEKILL